MVAIGVLTGMADEATLDQAADVVLASIAEYLGPRALEPVVYYESDWASEEWTRGAYAASFDLGGLSRYGKDQTAPVGRIHWANSDIAAEGYQHVDGALRRGRAAAEEILALAEDAAAPTTGRTPTTTEERQ